MPNEFFTSTNGEGLDLMAAKYAFFDEEGEANNFDILRQLHAVTEGQNTHTAGAVLSHRVIMLPAPESPEQSPHLPTDFSIDEDNLATAKLSKLNFKRPPSPSMMPATQEPVIRVEDVCI